MRRLKIVITIGFGILAIALLLISYKPPFTILEITESYPKSNSKEEFSFLTANVGNSNLRCRRYFWKLCISDVEENIRRNIEVLKPDVIVLQELLTYEKCSEYPTKNKDIVCSAYKEGDHQAARLLNDEYTIICDENKHMQCIGILNNFATVENCKSGGICLNGRTIPPIDGCNEGFSVFSVTVDSAMTGEFDIVNVHLNSQDSYCRLATFDLLLSDENLSIIESENILLAGDFNIDLYKDKEEASAINDIIDKGWSGKALKLHKPESLNSNPLFTFRIAFIKQTLDYVFSNFVVGDLVVLGETEGTARLDGGWGMDHKGIYGVFNLLPSK